ncbi:MAG: caspase family protein [Bacteroidota bacterium]
MKRLLLVSFGLFFFVGLWAQETKVIYGDSKPGPVSLEAGDGGNAERNVANNRVTEKPTIRLVGTYAPTVNNPQITLEALIQSQGPLIEITVSQNGIQRTIPHELGALKFDLKESYTLKRGKNRFVIKAINGAGKTESEVVSINFIPKDPIYQRKDYAILFATAKYEQGSGFDKLPNTIEGVESLKKELEEKYGFDEVVVVQNPTKAVISKTLIQFAKRKFNPYDQLFIFYTGHGTTDQLGRGYFVSSEGRTTDQFTSHNDFLEVVNLINCPHIMVVADACYSGRMSRYDKGSMSVSDDKPKRGSRLYREKNNYEFIKAMLDEQKKTRIFIASGSNKVPSGIKGQYTPFMFKFLESFEKANQDDEFLEYVELKKWLNKLQASTPVYGVFGEGSPNGTFLFISQ